MHLDSVFSEAEGSAPLDHKVMQNRVEHLTVLKEAEQALRPSHLSMANREGMACSVQGGAFKRLVSGI
jgi:hypothetical protein